MALAPVLPLSISLGDTQSERFIYMASAFAMLWPGVDDRRSRFSASGGLSRRVSCSPSAIW